MTPRGKKYYNKNMPGRLEPLVTGQVYHIFNQGINGQAVFTCLKEYKRAILALNYYRFLNPDLKLSLFLQKSVSERKDILKEKNVNTKKIIDILAYCLMPNHFHLLLRQNKDGGISKYLSQVQNSYTRYFNSKNKRKGPIFYDQFKAVRIEDDNQLLHVNRYIHLNPYSGFVVKNFKEIESYPWSSFREYLGLEKGICEKKLVLGFFKDVKDYWQFVIDRADYQRKISIIKHLLLEDSPPYTFFTLYTWEVENR